MLCQGSLGSLNLFWDGELVSSHPLGRRDLQWYIGKSNDFVLSAMKKGTSIDNIKEKCLYYIHVFGHRRTNNKRVSVEDHFIFLVSIFFMIKIKFYDEDDYIFIADRKRPRMVRE